MFLVRGRYFYRSTLLNDTESASSSQALSVVRARQKSSSNQQMYCHSCSFKFSCMVEMILIKQTMKKNRATKYRSLFSFLEISFSLPEK